MLDKIRKQLSDKRPRGAKLMKIIGLLSAMVWISAGSAFILVKKKFAHAQTEALGIGGTKAASGHAGAAGAEAGTADVGDHGVSLASVSGEEPQGNPDAEAGHGGGDVPVGEAPGGEAPRGIVSEKPEAEGHAEADEVKHADSHGETSEHGKATPESDDEERPPLPSREELAALRQVVELLYASGALEKAVPPLRKVMLMPTREIELLAMATDIFLGTANYKEALATAGQVLALKPENMTVRVQAVEAQYRMGEIEKAFAGAEAALQKHPGDLAMLTTLGTMQVEVGQGRKGYGAALAEVLKLKPDYGPAVYLQGRKAQLEGDYKDAEVAFRKVVKLEPRNAKAFGQLGIALYHLGKTDEAEKAYKSELEMNPLDYNTWYNLGEAHLARAADEWRPETIQSLRAEAMACFLKALDLNHDHAEAHYRVGVLLNGNGQYKEAIRHLEAALKTDSRHVGTLVQLSLAFENLKQPERARAYLNKAYELDPLNKVVLFKLKQWS